MRHTAMFLLLKAKVLKPLLQFVHSLSLSLSHCSSAHCICAFFVIFTFSGLCRLIIRTTTFAPNLGIKTMTFYRPNNALRLCYWMLRKHTKPYVNKNFFKNHLRCVSSHTYTQTVVEEKWCSMQTL